MNETQNAKLASQRQILVQRKDEMAHMDERIAELQARLRKKRMAAAANNNDNLLNIANRMRSNSAGNKLLWVITYGIVFIAPGPIMSIIVRKINQE